MVDNASQGQHTQGEWRSWFTGYTAAPYVIYAGEAEPSLDERGRLVMNGSAYIGEISSQAMRLDERENIVDEGAANARLAIASPNMLVALRFVLAAIDQPSTRALRQTNRVLDGDLRAIENVVRPAIAKASEGSP